MQEFLTYLINNQGRLLEETINHLVLLIIVPTFISIIIGVFLGVLIYKYNKLEFIIKIVSIIQNIPSLVLLTFMIMIGLGIGYVPAITALVIYGLMPIINNTYIGLNNIEEQYIITADALGMTSLQKLFKVELPMAITSILGGIRLSAVSNSGLAVLANLIGAGGLGVFILTGIYQLQYHIILVGAIPSVLITWLIDVGFLYLIKVSNKNH